ncbi:Kiwa anti-phage protein KwaB-like domain-containing protein [Bacillus subtilis]|uniref:Kiwa anti-phage protein KwaB-like domain-containing protein n=1 Tax=Bacillus subtilis TaxID=1423 RepID=UPI001642D305|nr:Kiwa anti-phage protein KwaB-like domain-containing protein [Bacillus subtilis]MCL8470499.1 DUF4868 domain-containing protein [Bacillus subtilis]MEC0361812.1 DUF4868 domain-containing protein [Bacillus subtilis]UNM81007.1 DUF4868 domain-containing protein [Bacillus subtilis]WEY89758.1 DUF4868 domain-containing protein [Bacillus subtilis]
MNLNDNDNIINILSGLDETEESDLAKFDYSLYMLKKQKKADVYYQASQVSLAPEVLVWAKKQLVNQIRVLKKNDEDDTNQFYVGDYNDEIQRKEQLAKLDMSNSQTLKKRKDDLISALRTNSDMYDEKTTNFIVARVMLDGQEALFSYYRGDKGAKKNAGRKKTKRIIYKNTNQFEFVEHTVIDLGGNFDFVLIDNFIFINHDTNFQYTFDYRDEINEKTEANLALITSMPFFEGEEADTEEFQVICKRFVYSRSLAQIKPDTLGALQEKFEERCNELSLLRQNIPQSPEEQEKYKNELGTIWDLFEFIDFDNKKIKFKKGESPKPLIHFFADKIARSFLTEEYKVVAAYE